MKNRIEINVTGDGIEAAQTALEYVEALVFVSTQASIPVEEENAVEPQYIGIYQARIRTLANQFLGFAGGVLEDLKRVPKG